LESFLIFMAYEKEIINQGVERGRETEGKDGGEGCGEPERRRVDCHHNGSGNREESAVDLGRRLLQLNDNDLRTLSGASLESLTAVKGIGPGKAVSLIAAAEMGKRFSSAPGKVLPGIQSSQSAAKLISPLLRDLPHEECWVMYLNRANKLISRERLSKGGLSATVVDVKFVIKGALERLASSIILIHNHPSGNAHPGESDKIQTKILKDAAALF